MLWGKRDLEQGGRMLDKIGDHPLHERARLASKGDILRLRLWNLGIAICLHVRCNFKSLRKL